MRSEYQHYESLVNYVMVHDTPGVLAEFGIWWGENFIKMAKAAAAKNYTSIAVDSFESMAEPTPQDAIQDPTGNIKQQYPRGSLSVVGTTFDYGNFVSRLVQENIYTKVGIYRGLIPDVLFTIPPETVFSFVHIDLNHYWPTLATINYVWPRISTNGFMVIHDYFKDNMNLAAGAVNLWRLCTAIPMVDVLPSRHIIFRKI